MQEWPIPRSITDVRQLLGLASYYQHYILHFSHIAAPLHALIQKDATFNWTEDCQHSFTTLKLTAASHIKLPSVSFDS